MKLEIFRVYTLTNKKVAGFQSYSAALQYVDNNKHLNLIIK